MNYALHGHAWHRLTFYEALLRLAPYILYHLCPRALLVAAARVYIVICHPRSRTFVAIRLSTYILAFAARHRIAIRHSLYPTFTQSIHTVRMIVAQVCIQQFSTVDDSAGLGGCVHSRYVFV